MRLIDSSEFVDRVLGKVGTPERDAIERRIKEEKDMKLYSFDSVLDRHIGLRGSEAREDFEREVAEAVESSNKSDPDLEPGQPEGKDRKYSKTYEAALKLKGCIKVNDPTLFFT